MKSTVPTRFAGILFAFVIGFMGVNHFLHPDTLSVYVPDFMPGSGKTWVYITGVGFILAALSIITGIMRPVVSYLLALTLIIIALSVQLHGLMNATDDITKTFFMTGLLKDLAMASAAIMIANHSSK